MSKKGNVTEVKEEKNGASVEELQTQLKALQDKYDAVSTIAVGAYTLITEVGHNNVQTGSALQEFVMKHKNTYAAVVTELMQKQQNQRAVIRK